MLGSAESLDTRLHSLTAASAAAKAVKRAHRAAALAVQTAAPPRPRSQYFAHNRNRPGSSLTSAASSKGVDTGESDDGEDEGEGRGRDGKKSGAGPTGQPDASGAGTTGGAGTGAARMPRISEDSTSSVSRSITSSGMSSEYTSGEETSEYDDEDDDEEEEEEEEEENQGPSGKPAGGATGLAPTASARLGSVAAAMEAVALARARLRQPPAGPGPGSLTTYHSAPVASPTGAASAADSRRLPPVVPRTRGGSHDAVDAGPSAPDGRRAEATAMSGGSLSSQRSPPVASTATLPTAAPDSRRASLLASVPATTVGGSGTGVADVAAAASAAVGLSLGAAKPPLVAAAAAGDKGECLAEWVSHRFRASSRTVIPTLSVGAEVAAAAGAAPPHGKAAPAAAAAGGGGEAYGGLRALLTGRSDGVASWYARPARWHDPLSPVGALHASVLDLRPSAHPPALHGPLAPSPPPPPASRAPLVGRARAQSPGSQTATGQAGRAAREQRRGSGG